MTVAKASAIAGGMLLTMAVGVWTGQMLAGTHGDTTSKDVTLTAAARPAGATAQPVAPRAADVGTRVVLTTKPVRVNIDASAPALHERIKPLLNSGADLTIAAAGFEDAEQFAAVAHAARNTNVPFMVLKHQVVDQGESLSKAIGQLKPDVNAAVEADRAVAEARSDIASLGL